jgi:hypothetical protein
MWGDDQACLGGTLSQHMYLGPARSSFERLFCEVDVGVSMGLVDRSELDLTNRGDSVSRLSHRFLLALTPRFAFIKSC